MRNPEINSAKEELMNYRRIHCRKPRTVSQGKSWKKLLTKRVLTVIPGRVPGGNSGRISGILQCPGKSFKNFRYKSGRNSGRSPKRVQTPSMNTDGLIQTTLEGIPILHKEFQKEKNYKLDIPSRIVKCQKM